MAKKLLLATRNPGKTVEIRDILGGLNFEILSLLDFPELPETLEDGETLEANAIKKATEAFRHTGIPSLADDTGLEVDALGMEPGVRSARFAGENVTYEQNNFKLLEALSGLTQEKRTAQFRCVAAYVDKGVQKTVEGACKGRILTELRGANGFGYDPLFLPDGFLMTFAQLDLGTKNRISHRARAFNAMRDYLVTLTLPPL